MAANKGKRGQLLSEGIFLELERRVINRIYPPGSHLIEDEIAEDLGVSRTPVREAFKALEGAGWLEIRPHAGAYVRHTTMEEVRDVFEVRQWLEERAAWAAVERITEAQIKTLRKIIEKAQKAMEKGTSPRTLATLNSSFHETVGQAAGNTVLADLLTGLFKHVHRHVTAIAGERSKESWDEHARIVEAIERGDAESAGRLIVEHSRKTQEDFLRHLTIRHRSPTSRI